MFIVLGSGLWIRQGHTPICLLLTARGGTTSLRHEAISLERNANYERRQMTDGAMHCTMTGPFRAQDRQGIKQCTVIP